MFVNCVPVASANAAGQQQVDGGDAVRGRALRARRGAQQDVPHAAQHGGARAALARLLAARHAPPRAARAPAPARLAAARRHRGLVLRVPAAHRVQVRGLVQVRAAGRAAQPAAAGRGATRRRRVPPALAARQGRPRLAAPRRLRHAAGLVLMHSISIWLLAI